MWQLVIIASFVLATGCTRPNPRSCADGECSDPAYPFCDVDGSFSGEQYTCIAVECTPMQFVACRGMTALTCNAAGNNYDYTDCEIECDPTAGCKLPPPPTECDPLAPFDPPVPLTGFATAGDEGTVQLSQDELTIYMGASFGTSDSDLWGASRTSRDATFSTPTRLVGVNSTSTDTNPTVTADGMTLIFASTRTGSMGFDLYVATRSSTLANFGSPALMANVNSSVDDYQPFLTADGAELWFASPRYPSQMADIWSAPRAGAGFGQPVRVPEVSSTAVDYWPVLSADRLTIYVSSNATGGATKGGFEIYRAHRANVTDRFPTPTLVAELNTNVDDIAAWISPDNCRLYISHGPPAQLDIMVATRRP